MYLDIEKALGQVDFFLHIMYIHTFSFNFDLLMNVW